MQKVIEIIKFLLLSPLELLNYLRIISSSTRRLRIVFTLFLCILPFLIWLGYKNLLKEEKKPIYLAFAGPLSGEGIAAGKSMTQAVQLHLDAINKGGGVNGRKVFLELFDDQNDVTKAEEKANEIAKKDSVLAVIGHWYSSCSISGGKVYKNFQIPAITPGSVLTKVTQGNEWYFRNVYNVGASGRFLADYVKNILQQNVVTIIHENAEYGTELATVFEDTAKKLGMEVKNKKMFKADSKTLDRDLEKIVYDLTKQQEAKEELGTILLAVQATEGVKLVRLLRDKGIRNRLIGESSFAEQTFKNGFDEFQPEKTNPGHYTNDIYVATPLIFDTANEKAQQFRSDYKIKYTEEPDWAAAYAYDSVLLLVEAIKVANIQGEPDTRKEDRKKIKQYLTNLTNARDAIQGVTGFNYFDENRDAQKPVALGVYKNKNIVSALTQLQVIPNIQEIYDLDATVKQGKIVLINEQPMYKTNVVYTGIEINEISDLDLKKLTYTLDFKLWFRFQGDVNPQDIEFLNTADSTIKMKKPVIEQTINQITYRLYRLKGSFKFDFLPSHHTFKQHILGISFRHKDLTRNNLVYVTDELGMGMTSGKEWVEKLKTPQVFSSDDWSIEKAWTFQDVAKKESYGDPRYANVVGGAIEYSRFNSAVLLKENELFSVVASLIAPKYMIALLGMSTFMLLFLFVMGEHPKFKRSAKTIWFFEVIGSLCFLLSSRAVLMDVLVTEQVGTYYLEKIIVFFSVLWWMIPAFLLNLATEHFVWTPLEEKTGRVIPNIVRFFMAFIVYFLATVGIIAFVLEQQLTSILATSGVFAMIIGLAIQINISNIFSGIAINVERPFRIGDWVKIKDYEEGEVINITWRSTRIKLRNQCVLSIPNSIASESNILNFCYPDDKYWLWPLVHIDEAHPPGKVKKLLLDAVLSSEKVMKDPPPEIIFLGIEDRGAGYWVVFCCDDYAKKFYILEDVWTRVWLHLNRAGIKPAIQRQEIYMFRGIKERGEAAATPITVLHEVEIFRPLSEGAKTYLSQRMRRRLYPAGEVIVQQGDAGDSLFIVVEGVVSVKVKIRDNDTEVARLGAGNFFGEMALLTGADRTATVVALTDTSLYEITKADLAPVMAKQPAITELFSRVLTERQRRTNRSREQKPPSQIKHEEETLRERIRNQISRYFGV